MSMVKNPMKAALRKQIKDILRALSAESKQFQSKAIANKILSSDVFRNSTRISIYLSTSNEVDTIDILREMFHQKKHVFVPTYQGDVMEMVRLHGMADYDCLPLTKWNIKQPSIEEGRESALDKGGLDLFLVPGVAFTADGRRLGHGMGYYDKYLTRHFEKFPDKIATGLTLSEKLTAKKTIIIGLAFKEQMVDKGTLPLDPHDFVLDTVFTCD